MDADARAALTAVEALAGTAGVAVAGRFMPDPGVQAHLARLGVTEQVAEADFFRYRQLLIPFSGVAPRVRKRWEEADFRVTDMTSPQVRRAQVALGLLRMEGAQALVIGRHDDPESLALAGMAAGTRIIQDTTDTARLHYSPAFGVVCQTTLSPRRVSWLLQQLRMRYPDARVTFLNTATPAMSAREQALEELLDWCDSVLVVGQPGEASCEALVEAALRKGKAALTAGTPAELDPAELAGARRLALTAGAFALDDSVRAIAAMLLQASAARRAEIVAETSRR
jgi:4-hydroxy-3-methylbut-2-enyl diphosphate reductase